MSSEHVQRLLEDGELEAALKALVAQARTLDERLADDATLLLSRYRTLERQSELGTLAPDAASAQRAQLTQSALKLARRLGAAAPVLRVVRLFLASSSELRADRDAFDLFVRQQNDRLRDQGLYLEVVRWETFLDAMSETRLQDEYNRAVQSSDLFVSLFFTKAGRFTEEEFDAAHRAFQAHGKPRIYTYFRTGTPQHDGTTGEEHASLRAFRERLKSLGHYVTLYSNVEDLKLQFRGQLDRLGELLTRPRA
jgi:hypothetical protein